MNHWHLLLADVDAADLLDAQRHLGGSRFAYVLVTFGSMTLVIIIAAILCVHYSLNKKKRPHHHKRHRGGKDEVILGLAPNAPDPPPPPAKARKKWRRPRRPHRPLNPTLAQTGGLPPVRDERALPPVN